MCDCYLEESVLKSINLRLLLYFRYVDNIILAIPKEKTVFHILKKFDSYYHRLKFTIELENNRCLSFLDMSLNIVNNKIIDWFHKKNFFEEISVIFFQITRFATKSIYSLVDQAIFLSHPSFHKKNFKLCINILMDNGYSLETIFNTINRRLKKLFVQRVKPATSANNFDIDTNSNIERKIIVFFLHKIIFRISDIRY